MRSVVRPTLIALATLLAAAPAWADGGYTIQTVGLTGGNYLGSNGSPLQRSLPSISNSQGVAIGSSNIYNGGSTSLGTAYWYYTPGAGSTQIGLTTANGSVYGNPTKQNAVTTSVSGLNAVNLSGSTTSAEGSSSRFDVNGNSLGRDAWYFDGSSTVAIPLPTSTNTSTTDPAGYAYSVTTGTGQFESGPTPLVYGGGGAVAGASNRYTTTATSSTDASTSLGYDTWYYANNTTTVVGLNYSNTNANGNTVRQSSIIQVSAKGLTIGWTSNSPVFGSEGWLYDPNNAHGTGLNGTIALTPTSSNSAYVYAGSAYSFTTANAINSAGQISGNWYLYNAAQSSHNYNQPTQSMAAFIYDSNVPLNADGSTNASAWTQIGLMTANDPVYYVTSPSVDASTSQGSQVNPYVGSTNNSPLNALGQAIGYTTRQINTDPGQPDNVATSMGKDAWVYYPANHVPINGTAGTVKIGLSGGPYDKTIAVNSINYTSRSSSAAVLSNSGAVAGTTFRVSDPNGTASAGADAWVYDPLHGITTSTQIGLVGVLDPNNLPHFTTATAGYENVTGSTNNTRSSSVSAINNTGEVGGTSVRYAFGTANGQDAWVYDAASRATYNIDTNTPALANPANPHPENTFWYSTITSISDGGLVMGYDSAVSASSGSQLFAFFLGGALHNQPHFFYYYVDPTHTDVDAASIAAGNWSVLGQTSAMTPVTAAGGIFGYGTLSGNASSSMQTFLLSPKAMTYNGGSASWNTASGNTNFTYSGGASSFGNGAAVTFGNTGVGTINVDPTGVYVASMNVTNTTGTYTFSNGSVGGETLIKSGAGIVNFSGGAYFGNVTLNGGVAVFTPLSVTTTASFALSSGSKMVVQGSAGTKAGTLATLQGDAAAHSLTITGLAGNFGLAVMDNGMLNKSTFGGVAVDGNSVLVSAELLGDANADGHVDLTDLSTVLNNFGMATPNWTSGNFDYAPTIDLTDLSDVLNNFGSSNANAFDSTVFDSAVVAVPEPAGVSILSFGAIWLLKRRRR